MFVKAGIGYILWSLALFLLIEQREMGPLVIVVLDGKFARLVNWMNITRLCMVDSFGPAFPGDMHKIIFLRL